MCVCVCNIECKITLHSNDGTEEICVSNRKFSRPSVKILRNVTTDHTCIPKVAEVEGEKTLENCKKGPGKEFPCQ